MAMNGAVAANAYAAAKNLVSEAGGGKGGASDPSQFADLLKSAVEGTAQSGRSMEMKAADLVQGKANVVDVVTAVAETELAVQTLVTVRDKVITAYKDIVNMPI